VRVRVTLADIERFHRMKAQTKFIVRRGGDKLARKSLSKSTAAS